MPDIDDVIRRRIVRNQSNGPLELAPRRDAIPDKAREIDIRLPFMPGLPSLDGLNDTEQLTHCHTGALETAKRIRQAADRAWNAEPSVQGVALTPAQKLSWRREHVRNVIASEMEKASKLLKPIPERGRKELAERRAKLVEKGSPKPDDIGARRAMMIGESLAKLSPEARALQISEALQRPDDKESRELLSAVAWLPESLALCAPETRQLIQGTLVAVSDSREYDALTTFDRALAATEQSIEALETWSAQIPSEY